MDKLHLAIFLAIFSTLSLVLAPFSHASTIFTSTTNFPVPNYRGNIRFSQSGSYETATLENDTWTFTGLDWNGVSGKLGVSAQNSNMTLTSYEPEAVTYNGAWLNYTVQGMGSQTINLRYDAHGFPAIYSLYIDGAAKPENEGWSMPDNGHLIVTSAIANVSIFYGAVPPPDADYNPQPSESRTDQTFLFLFVGIPIVAAIVLIALPIRAKKNRKNPPSA